MTRTFTRFNSSSIRALSVSSIIVFAAMQAQAQKVAPIDQQVVVELAEIEKQGGTIDIEKSDGEEVSSLAAPKENVKDKQITALRFLDLKKLQLALSETAKLKQIKRLDINFCWTGPRTLSTAELDKITALASLEELTLADTAVDGQQLKRLAKMPNLTTVRLRELNGHGVFTDVHLDGLAHLTSLKTLDVAGAREITPKAVERFQNARPHCKVVAPPKKRQKVTQ